MAMQVFYHFINQEYVCLFNFSHPTMDVFLVIINFAFHCFCFIFTILLVMSNCHLGVALWNLINDDRIKREQLEQERDKLMRDNLRLHEDNRKLLDENINLRKILFEVLQEARRKDLHFAHIWFQQRRTAVVSVKTETVSSRGAPVPAEPQAPVATAVGSCCARL